jgi:hypothetical protein
MSAFLGRITVCFTACIALGAYSLGEPVHYRIASDRTLPGKSNAASDVLPYALQHKLLVLSYGAICRGLLSGTMKANRKFGGDDLRLADPKFQRPRFTQHLKASDRLGEGQGKKGQLKLPRLKKASKKRGQVKLAKAKEKGKKGKGAEKMGDRSGTGS